jgi:hypothetical protein
MARGLQNYASKENEMRMSMMSSMALVALAASACEQGYDESLDDSQAVPVATETAAITSSQSHAEIFHWNSDQPDVQLRPVRTHLCYLTEVTGNLDAQGAIAVHRDIFDINVPPSQFNHLSNDASPNWKLSGWPSLSNSMSGDATCVPLADFTGPPGTTRKISSYGYVSVDTSWPGCSSSTKVDMLPKGIGFISGVRGDFSGGGESIEIEPPTFDHPRRLKIGTQTCALYEGYGYSFDVGVPGHTQISNFGFVKSVTAHSGQYKKERLDTTRSSICYFTRISGSFDGHGERLRIFPAKDTDGVEYWWLEAKAEGGSAYGTASCIPYDQTPVPVL